MKKEIIFGIIILLISTSLLPVFSGQTTQQAQEEHTGIIPQLTPGKTATVTFYTVEKTKLEKHTMTVSTQDATQIYLQLQELKKELTTHQYNERTYQLEHQFLSLLEQKHVIPAGVTQQDLMTLLQPPETPIHSGLKGYFPLQGKASEWFCNFATIGDGSAFPIIILPRIIPFILMPIPRAFVYWTTPEGITSVGGLISRTGFIAGGQQKGIALGFWGIGFSIFLPPIMSYGIFGYAVFTKVTAEQFQFYPPNNPPEITQTDPVDGQQMVPLSTTELRFSISDADGDLMSYSVTTDPDIGSGSGGLKPDGMYSVPISGLDSLTTYSWHIQLTDGQDTIEKTLSFITEPVAPIITNPLPADGARDIPMDIPSLQFTLKDYQGDAMDYTVQTSPNIGSTHVTGVHDGTNIVPISGMTYGAAYRWYVNVTDGTHWTRKVFSFDTGYPSQYNPFEFGWLYRKQITINHTQVSADFEDFPVLISTTDGDLTKAQMSGIDIVFMEGPNVASRLDYEIETFDQSSGSLAAFVNIPTLSSTQDTVLYMYYGNPSCINQQYPEKVWNPDFRAVWHLQESPIGTIHDSTSNTNDATSHGVMGSANVVQGKVGNCLSFDGIDDYLAVPDSTSLKPTEVTILCWVNMAAPIMGRSVLGKGCMDEWGNQDAVSYGISYINGEMGSNCEKDDNTATIAKYTAAENTWSYVAMTYDSASTMIQYYQDGTLRDSLSHGQSLRYSSPWDFVFAAGHVGTGSGVNYFANCKLDEIWIADTHLSPGWILTTYQNQNDPAAFLSFGPEVPGP